MQSAEVTEPKYKVDAVRPLQRYNVLRISCDDNVDVNDFKLSKPMPDEIINGLENMINFFEKYGLYHHLETLEKLIQYLSDSDIKLEYLHGISYMPREEVEDSSTA